MRHNVKGRKFGRNSTHVRAMIRNLTTSLFRYGSIKTTVEKAKETRPFAEKLITRAISGTLADKRIVIGRLCDRAVAHHLFNDIAPELKDRKGGYLRIIKLGPRDGDGAEQAIIEIITGSTEKRKAKKAEKKVKKATKAEKKKTGKETKKAEEEKPEPKSETPQEHEKVHSRDEQAKEHLAFGSKAEGAKTPKPKDLLNRAASRPKTPPPSSQER